MALAEAGYVEVLPFPFVGPPTWDAFGLAADDPRRRTVPVRNPLDADRAELATTLLPGLLDTLVRNRSRGAGDLALFTVGQVVLPHREQVADARAGRRPDVRRTPRSRRSPPRCPPSPCTSAWCWPATGNPADGGGAVDRRAGPTPSRPRGSSARPRASSCGSPRRDNPPWHPGRCAMLRVGDFPVGFAGELHPKVVDALGLPPRTCAMELDLDLLPLVDDRPAPRVSPYPPVAVDVALVAEAAVPAAGWPTPCWTAAATSSRTCGCSTSTRASRWARASARWPTRLRFRAPDRTLTSEEANAARDAAVAVAAQRHGADAALRLGMALGMAERHGSVVRATVWWLSTPGAGPIWTWSRPARFAT